MFTTPLVEDNELKLVSTAFLLMAARYPLEIGWTFCVIFQFFTRERFITFARSITLSYHMPD